MVSLQKLITNGCENYTMVIDNCPENLHYGESREVKNNIICSEQASRFYL